MNSSDLALVSALISAIPKGDKGDKGDPGDVESVAGKTGAVILDADDVAYDPTDTYSSGTIGEAVSDLKSQINNSLTPYVTDTMTAPAALSVGDFVLAANTLYRVIAPIANGATITPNTNVIATTEADELKRKANTDGNYPDMTVGNAEQLVATVGVEDKVPYLFRTSGGSADIGDREVDEIVGGTVAWNQLVPAANFAASGGTVSTDANYVATFTASASGQQVYRTVNYVKDHVTIEAITYKTTTASAAVKMRVFSRDVDGIASTNWQTVYDMIKASNSGTTSVGVVDRRESDWDAVNVKNAMFIDLTQMFGPAIANYVYALEQNNAGDGIAWFRKLFPKDYYAYDAGTLMSVKTSAHRTVGFNAYDNSTGKAKVVGGQVYQITGTYTAVSLEGTEAAPDASGYFTPSTTGELTVTGGDGSTCIHLKWDGSRDGEYEPYEAHTYALDSDLELRGIPKLDADNKLYFDGDTYKDDGTVTRKIVEFQATTCTGVGVASTGVKYATVPLDSIAVAEVSSNGFLSNAKYAFAVSAPATDGYFRINQSLLYIFDDRFTDKDTAISILASEKPHFVYKLAAPATESADPYTNPQIVNDFGTEEYVDSRDVPIPVGHVTQYQANLRAKLEMAPDSPDGDGDYIVRQSSGQNTYVPLVLPLDELPAAPDTDGTYVLKVTVASGDATYSWVSE